MKDYKELMRDYQKVNRYKEELMTVGGFDKLPVIAKTSMEIARDIILQKDLKTVLDIGANDKKFKGYLKDHEVQYFSLDRDKSMEHDFCNLSEVGDKRFDIMVLFAVIEHLSLENYVDRFIPFFQKSLSDRGYLLVSSNNIFHNLGIRTDYSHIRSYSPRDLHAIMRNFGFKTAGVYRISMIPGKFRWIYDVLSKTIFKPYGLDYAGEICWIFRKAD